MLPLLTCLTSCMVDEQPGDGKSMLIRGTESMVGSDCVWGTRRNSQAEPSITVGPVF